MICHLKKTFCECIFAMIFFWEVINIFRGFGSSTHFYIWNQLDFLLCPDTGSQLIKEKVYGNETFLLKYEKILIVYWKSYILIYSQIHYGFIFLFLHLASCQLWVFCSDGSFISIFSSVRKMQNVGRCWGTEIIILIYLSLDRLLLRNIWLLLHIFHSHSKSIRSAISSTLTKKCIFMIHNWK